MKLISRTEWGARAPKKTPSTFLDVENIYVHHTTGNAPTTPEQSFDMVRSDQNYHMDHNDWADIGYSFMFDNFGQVFEGRGWGVVGAHTFGHNSDGHGFAFIGDGDKELTPEAMDALRYLVRESDNRYGVKPIKGHRDAPYATHCPGDWLEAHRDVRSDAPVPTPQPAPAPAPAPAPSYPQFAGVLLRRGSKGGAVAQFQVQLQRRGWKLAADGDFGPATENVVKQFQAEKGLGVDGIVGPATWNAAYTMPIT